MSREATVEEGREAERLYAQTKVRISRGQILYDAAEPIRAVVMRRNDLKADNTKLRELLESTRALIGNGHVCESRPHTSEDCGRCFSCCCGQLRQGIDAALMATTETKPCLTCKGAREVQWTTRAFRHGVWQPAYKWGPCPTCGGKP